MKFDEQINSIFRYIILIISIGILICLFLLFFDLVLNRLHLSSWDPLAFIGSILGGLLTLFGVRYTIKSQQRGNFINSYPKIVMELEGLASNFEMLNIVIDDFGKGIDNPRFVKEVITFQGSYKKYLEKAASIDAKTYFTSRDFIYKSLKIIDIIFEDETVDRELASKDFALSTIKHIDELRGYIKEYLVKYQKCTGNYT